MAAETSHRHYSRAAQQALTLLAQQIQLERKRQGMTEEDLASRVGVARSTLRKIEAGNPAVAIGLALETAAILGLPLFGEDSQKLAAHSTRLDEWLTLLPRSIRHKQGKVSDDF